jgi:G3E family GTPase
MATSDDLVPVTVLTGFLGSGKTTLLNYILTEQHGRRIAVIENEFGEIGIDDALVIDAEEEIFEMNNGCICCTVRGDLIRILGNLMKRRDRFDQILIETTGLADPAPVAQTFFVDPEISSQLRLDAIVTVVDAKHLIQHLNEVKPEGVENEAVEQLAFADRVVLNKTDLVDEAGIAEVRQRISEINAFAPIIETTFGKVDLSAILDVGAFDLDRVLAAIDSEKAVTPSHDVDLNSAEKKNVLLVLLMQPTPDECDQLVEECGMRPYNSVSNKSPVCTFAGTVAPRDVAALIVRYGGVLLPNPKPQTFGQPQRTGRDRRANKDRRSEDTADAGADPSTSDADPRTVD